MLLEGIDLLMDLISKSRYIVALTGAGISTNAGLSDFRGPDGIYARKDIDADKIFNIKYFKTDPAYFYQHIGDLFDGYLNALPTKGHMFLKKLEELGKLKTIITQNVDGLHNKAGNSYIIDIHGNFNIFKCLHCKNEIPITDEIIQTINEKKVPIHTCEDGEKGVLKPNIVFFGEPVFGLEKALTEVQKGDMLITMGTSLTVYPVAQLPSYITDNAKLIIINNTYTPYDNKAHLVINKDIDEVAQTLGLL